LAGKCFGRTAGDNSKNQVKEGGKKVGLGAYKNLWDKGDARSLQKPAFLSSRSGGPIQRKGQKGCRGGRVEAYIKSTPKTQRPNETACPDPWEKDPLMFDKGNRRKGGGGPWKRERRGQ